MRLAVLLRHRRCLFMQPGSPFKASQPPASRITSRLKRPYGQAATVLQDSVERDIKQARVEDSTSEPGSSFQTFPRDSKRETSASNIIMPTWGRASTSSGRGSSSRGTRRRGGKDGGRGPSTKVLGLHQHSEPLCDRDYVESQYRINVPEIPPSWEQNSKSTLTDFMLLEYGSKPAPRTLEGVLNGERLFRTTVPVIDGVIGQGDAKDRKQSEKIACFSAVLQLASRGLIGKQKGDKRSGSGADTVELSDGSKINHERARQFMDYYCRKFGFGKPDIALKEARSQHGTTRWEAVMTVGGRRIGLGSAKSKKDAQTNCYLDVVKYLEGCDRELWLSFEEAAKTGKDLGLAPRVLFQISERLEDDIRDLCSDIRQSSLYKNRPAIGSGMTGSDLAPAPKAQHPLQVTQRQPPRIVPGHILKAKSEDLQKRREAYLRDLRLEKMRETRASLPVYTRASDILAHIADNEVTICMAATGSGKTTQIPQLILDSWIDDGRGSHCNVICTQPRRIAAISVADRVAKERGEIVGQHSTIGYQVRFEAKMPDEHGSVTFCTTGIFLKRLQSALQPGGRRSLDEVTHIVVDEVHERDVDTDLLLVVLKRLLADRKERNIPIKIILMSATIDPTLFQNYFPDEAGKPAKVIEIPGRSFPVEKYFLDQIVPEMIAKRDRTSWVFSDEKVVKYLHRELGSVSAHSLGVTANHLRGRSSPIPEGQRDREDELELELPYPLVALTISHVLQRSDSGHVLVFLPGWEDIQAVQRILMDPSLYLGLDFTNHSNFRLHVLHSTIPLAEQQQIFEPAPAGIRRVILSTNIAETSVTIPDVVYVVDSAKIKENRYDPERHMSSLVSAWVGSSNLNQRAGRAGRHRPGEYYGILGIDRANGLHSHQTVEMKRSDLSNVVMHVKALDFPDIELEDVLASTIEPPDAGRVSAAINNLTMVGALDSNKNLTSLGRVLLQLPVEAQMGRLVLFGSFFRCLDQALTLAAILTNRDPFLNPPLLKKEAAAVKDSWTPADFRSDALAVLRAYNKWWSMQGRADYQNANRFANDNFLYKPTLMMIAKIKGHLLQSLYNAGVLDVSAGGGLSAWTTRNLVVPPELNVNGDSLPLLAALIAVAFQPKFAIRTSPMTYRTAIDKSTAIHPSSVNHRKREVESEASPVEKQIIAFGEKRQNLSVIGSAPGQTYLVGCTRLDPMTYLLFGAYRVEVLEQGVECDEWLPMVGNIDALDEVQRLKVLMESCMLRVFEGINMSRRSRRDHHPNMILTRSEKDESDDDDDSSLPKDLTLSSTEVKELDYLTRDIVHVLDKYSEERIASQSRRNSRPATPLSSPFLAPSRQLGGMRSGASTPYNLSYDSRPGTPSRLAMGSK